MNKTQLAKTFIRGDSGSCHNAHTDGQVYTLHKSPIVVKCGSQYQFYWHGYYTNTTASHMNEVLGLLGAPFRVGWTDAKRRGEDVFVWEERPLAGRVDWHGQTEFHREVA